MVTRIKKAKAVAHEEAMPPEPEVDQIAVRAYEIHESGGGGDAVENWLQAERELLTPMVPA